MSEEKYGLIVHSHEEKYQSGAIATEKNAEFWVINGEWSVSSTLFNSLEKVPKELKAFDTREEAEKFAKSWKGHPWWCRPNGKFRIVKVVEQYRKVFDGYKIDDDFNPGFCEDCQMYYDTAHYGHTCKQCNKKLTLPIINTYDKDH